MRTARPLAVPGGNRALAVFNAARSYLPEPTALAANSSFLDRVDTGLACARSAHARLPPRGILLAGMATEVCVTQTSVTARELGYKVTTLAGACACVDERLEAVALEYLGRSSACCVEGRA